MIKVGFLLSVDAEYVKRSLPCVYEYADLIVYAIDRNRISWSGNKFEFDDSILDWIKKYDTKGKVRIYEDDFYVDTNSPMENDTHQRNMLAKNMGEGGWHLHIDVDEYFINFKGFVEYLNSKGAYLNDPKNNPITISLVWFNLFKSDNDGFYYIKNPLCLTKIATNYPVYLRSRNTYQRNIFVDFVILHQAWDKSEDEIFFKINNWSHRDEVDTNAYFEFWKSVNKTNYHSFNDFSPNEPKSAWHEMGFIPAKSIKELMNYLTTNPFKVSKLFLLKKNIIQQFLRIPFLNKWYFKRQARILNG